MGDTYSPHKKGKIKKDREQELVIEEDNNLGDDGDADLQGNSPNVNNGVGGGNIEFYNRSPRVGYETNDDNKNTTNNIPDNT